MLYMLKTVEGMRPPTGVCPMRYDIDGTLRKDGTLPKPSNLYDPPREVTFTIAHDQEAILVYSKQYPDAKAAYGKVGRRNFTENSVCLT